MKIVYVNFVFPLLFYVVDTAPQYPEISDQFEETNHTEIQMPEVLRHTEVEKLTEVDKLTEVEKLTEVDKHPDVESHTASENTKTETTKNTEIITVTNTQEPVSSIELNTEVSIPQPGLITKFYNTITEPIVKFLKIPRVNIVLTNIGTCIVNGAMEIISFYFPAPLIPLLAAAAGLVIPFEPVVMLREKMPVTSYRRAFKTAVNGFLGTFDKYKFEEDPYMTARFNRRFMKDSKEEKEEDEIQL